MFYEAKDFPFSAVLEDNWQVILEEYRQLKTYQFQPWYQRDMYQGDWRVFSLFDWPSGKTLPGARYCPRTVEIIRNNIKGHAAAGFSILKPKTVIEPHEGYQGTLLRCHLGLQIPAQCGLDVCGDTRTWAEGRVMIFDDTRTHSAWNHSDQERVILLLDFDMHAYHPPEFYQGRRLSAPMQPQP